MIRLLEKNFPDHQIIPFAYDWRFDLIEVSKELDSVIKKLRESKVKSISAIGHSMGGYLLAYYLRFGTQEADKAQENWSGRASISKTVFMGSPFRGSTAIFKNMVRGVNFYFNKRLLPKETVASIPSSYYLLPEHHREIFEPHLWAKRNIGLFNQGLHPKTKEKRLAFTAKYLGRANRFQQLVLSPTQTKDTGKNLNVIGTGRKTHGSYLYAENVNHYAFFTKEVKALGEKAAIVAEGDVAVTISSATMPDAYTSTTKEIRSTFEHSLLFCDAKVQTEMIDFLKEE
jgi:hypothetical protein